MKKQCDATTGALTILGHVDFECTKKDNHHGKHVDAYGDKWAAKKEGK
jgi:hypothetical protein